MPPLSKILPLAHIAYSAYCPWSSFAGLRGIRERSAWVFCRNAFRDPCRTAVRSGRRAVGGLWLRGKSPILALGEEEEARAELRDSEVARAQEMLFDSIALLLKTSEHGVGEALPSDFLHARDVLDDLWGSNMGLCV